jgi:hypothetical protein
MAVCPMHPRVLKFTSRDFRLAPDKSANLATFLYDFSNLLAIFLSNEEHCLLVVLLASALQIPASAIFEDDTIDKPPLPKQSRNLSRLSGASKRTRYGIATLRYFWIQAGNTK